MLHAPLDLELTLAHSQDDIRAAQRLRYRVFVEELGGAGPGVDAAAGLETDRFDAHADHLLLRDPARRGDDTDGVVGVYRLMTREQAVTAGGFYSASEFDLEPLMRNGGALGELGRSCLHPAYRGSGALMKLWQGLARYVEARGIETLFGVASFHGTDLARLQNALSHLHNLHLAPEPLRVRTLAPDCLPLLALEQIDSKAAMREVPPLIKSYLKLGGMIGQGVYPDHAFNTTDLCLILPVNRLQPNAVARRLRAGA
ncbi:GNAT family N-acyltransferase [Marivita sp. GX14005]|uniref:GNAT family N-acetyltransferase n=1 Tax=Marivita sp. GX14005 TaxID=2942276 RepID=UPI002019F2F6|nr:GNAT family N-acyltransferase [Marivita sp. GX14005]MCL3882820.1 GNAT family N-acetyltransferase [Marivita sp. GX14005]